MSEKDLGFKEKNQSGYHSTCPPQLINPISCIPPKDLTNFGFGINQGSETKLIIKGKINTQALQIVCCLQMPNQTNWLSACIDGNPPNSACWVTHQNYTKIESIMVTSPSAIINPTPSSSVLDYSYLLNSVTSIFYNKDLHHEVNPSSPVSQEVKKHCHLSNLHMSTFQSSIIGGHNSNKKNGH
jgi:hypothetical protein